MQAFLAWEVTVASPGSTLHSILLGTPTTCNASCHYIITVLLHVYRRKPLNLRMPNSFFIILKCLEPIRAQWPRCLRENSDALQKTRHQVLGCSRYICVALYFLGKSCHRLHCPATQVGPQMCFFFGGGEQFSGGTLEVIVLSRARACNGDRAIQSQFTV